MPEYPANWNHYCTYVSIAGIGAFGFIGEPGDVNRFGARFRAAKSFRGVDLEGYSPNTAAGYSALCRVLFVWSAFESFLRIIGRGQREIGPLLLAHGGDQVLHRMRELDNDGAFYQFIYVRVNNSHKGELDTFRNNDPCNVAYLASAIRHIFAHGHLTPNANAVEPTVCVQICDILSDFLLYVMDREFGNRVAEFLEEIHGS